MLAYEVRRRLHEVLVSSGEGQTDPFVLVVEGSIPNEKIKKEGYWAALGTDPTTGQPITTNEWIDRLAPKAVAVIGCGTCATYGGIHAMQGNPTGCMGLADYLGWDWRSKAGLPIVNVPGCPVQPDNFMETVLYLLYQVAGLAPMIPLDDQLRPTWLFGSTVHEGCDRAGYYEQGDFADRIWLSQMHREAGMLGTGGELQCSQTRMDGRDRWLPQRRWHLHRLHHAGLSRTSSCRSWMSRPAQGLDRSGRASMAAPFARLRSLTQSTVNKEPKWRHLARRTDHRLSRQELTDKA